MSLYIDRNEKGGLSAARREVPETKSATVAKHHKLTRSANTFVRAPRHKVEHVLATQLFKPCFGES